MKKITLSMITALAMSTFAVAGGDIAPVEPEVTLPEVVEESTGAFYVGVAYGMVNTEMSYTDGQDTLSLDIDHSTVMLQAGYQFNPYLAIEGRYWMAVGDADATLTWTGEGSGSESGDLDDDSSVWGIYVKPMYPVTSEFTVYALLGYGNVELDLEGASADESDFQWGLGASYAFSDNLSVFVDYVSLYDDSESFVFEREPLTADIEVDSWNFGITYKF